MAAASAFGSWRLEGSIGSTSARLSPDARRRARPPHHLGGAGGTVRRRGWGFRQQLDSHGRERRPERSFGAAPPCEAAPRLQVEHVVRSEGPDVRDRPLARTSARRYGPGEHHLGRIDLLSSRDPDGPREAIRIRSRCVGVVGIGLLERRVLTRAAAPSPQVRKPFRSDLARCLSLSRDLHQAKRASCRKERSNQEPDPEGPPHVRWFGRKTVAGLCAGAPTDRTLPEPGPPNP